MISHLRSSKPTKKTKKTLKIINHIFHSYYTQMLHVWNIYLHVQPKWPKCRWIFHIWSVWDIFHSYFQTFIHYIPLFSRKYFPFIFSITWWFPWKKTTILVGSPFMEPPIFGPSIDYIHPLKIIYIYISRCVTLVMFVIFSVESSNFAQGPGKGRWVAAAWRTRRSWSSHRRPSRPRGSSRPPTWSVACDGRVAGRNVTTGTWKIMGKSWEDILQRG